MISLHSLPKIVSRNAKRVGRGIGSGKGGHTAGRGQKGQKSREGVSLTFDGTKNKKSLLKRLPVLRGKGKFKPLRISKAYISLDKLNVLAAKSQVTLELLKENNLVEKDVKLVKVLGRGDIKIALTVKVNTSKGARAKIEKAGGIVA